MLLHVVRVLTLMNIGTNDWSRQPTEKLYKSYWPWQTVVGSRSPLFSQVTADALPIKPSLHETEHCSLYSATVLSWQVIAPLSIFGMAHVMAKSINAFHNRWRHTFARKYKYHLFQYDNHLKIVQVFSNLDIQMLVQCHHYFRTSPTMRYR